MCQIVFNLAHTHGVSFTAGFGEKFKWKAEMTWETHILKLQSLDYPQQAEPILHQAKRDRMKQFLRKQSWCIWIFLFTVT